VRADTVLSIFLNKAKLIFSLKDFFINLAFGYFDAKTNFRFLTFLLSIKNLEFTYLKGSLYILRFILLFRFIQVLCLEIKYLFIFLLLYR
jgi:hypothetical protein